MQTTGCLLRACSAIGQTTANFSELARAWIGRPEADLLERSGGADPPPGKNKVLKHEQAELSVNHL